VENVRLEHLILHLCPSIQFPSLKKFSHDFFLSLEEKTKQTYVFPFLEKHHFVTISFDLWMSKDVHDVFAMVIFFIGI
jgi:hypothetical protein